MEFNFSYQRNQKRLTALAILAMLFSITFASADAEASAVLKCLGREELELHRKRDIGPRYTLNQVFLNKLSSNAIDIKKKYSDQICTTKSKRPSLILLKILLLKQRDIFDIKISKDRIDGLENFKISQANEFVAQAADVFFEYISGVQSMAPTPNCLIKRIPPIKGLFKRYRYLEEEVAAVELLNDKKEILEIFKGLENIDNIFSICERDKKKKKK
jgi:hypothetical protein